MNVQRIIGQTETEQIEIDDFNLACLLKVTLPRAFGIEVVEMPGGSRSQTRRKKRERRGQKLMSNQIVKNVPEYGATGSLDHSEDGSGECAAQCRGGGLTNGAARESE